MPAISTTRSTHTMTVVDGLVELRRQVAVARNRGDSIGLVPTMGALHAGHLSLIETAREECEHVVVTIFVNPTQFGPHEDFNEYPRPLETDLGACRKVGVDLVFCPSVELMYPPGFDTYVDVEGLSTVLEGAYRPGHFRGVATVVLKLFQMVAPHVAYFGRKDYQQQLLIRRMCSDLEIPIDLRTCPTVREPDGLALSSRNSYLTPAQRQRALTLSQSLRLARDRLILGEQDLERIRQAMRAHMEAADLKVDYATLAHPQTLEEPSEPLPEMIAVVAARVDKTRLIDNMPIRL